LSHGDRRRGARAWVARRIGRFLGVSDLFKGLDQVRQKVDAQEAAINACRASIHELRTQLASPLGTHPERSLATARPMSSRASTTAPSRRWRKKLTRSTARDPFQTVWVGPRLSALERLSLTSFLHHGHDVHLYTYEPVEGVPEGVRCFDAREILGEDRVFRHGPEAGPDAMGSLATWSDLFRYKLLRERGGWWFDADVTCLRPFDFRQSFCFGRHDESLVATTVMHVPKNSELMKVLVERAEAKVSKGALKWLDIGAPLFTEAVAECGLERFVLAAPALDAVPWQRALDLLEEDPGGALWSRLDGSYAVHFCNDLIRRNGLDKDEQFAATSVFERLKRQYGVAAPP
jgi:Glycosyltransferase sugar-binding region containing DXD motif